MDFTGRGELAERQVCVYQNGDLVKEYVDWVVLYLFLHGHQQKLAQMLSRITKIAEEFNVAVYMTNQGKTICDLVTAVPWVVCELTMPIIQKAATRL